MTGTTAVRVAIGLAGSAAAAAWGASAQQPALEPQASGTTVVLQAVHAVSDRVVWVSGHGGVVLRTTDGGARWTRVPAPGGDSLQFRDLHAADSSVVWILAAGPGDRSRIYHTRDGGHTWTTQFVNADSSAFFDCFAFWDDRRGAAFSDAVGGAFVVLLTDDGGVRWRRVPAAALPPAQPGEGAFAASGTCVVALGTGHAWIGTGAADTARVLRTTDGGRTWAAAVVPVPGGRTAGLASLAFLDTLHGIAVGGDVADAAGRGPNAARTADGGRTWRPVPRTAFPGAAFGAVVVPGTRTLVAVGPGGMSWVPDGGDGWAPLDTLAYWSVGFAPGGRRGWAVGPAGRITRLSLPGSAGQ